jgi:hypothetical protein
MRRRSRNIPSMLVRTMPLQGVPPPDFFPETGRGNRKCHDSSFGKTPCTGIVTNSCTGILRLRRRMRSDFAQGDKL